ncbi:unnamed protein product [Pedinophyceae sp. YPF-701]|nr:unnamed protein product [Pedinophyceae sp. YPF-701]
MSPIQGHEAAAAALLLAVDKPQRKAAVEFAKKGDRAGFDTDLHQWLSDAPTVARDAVWDRLRELVSKAGGAENVVAGSDVHPEGPGAGFPKASRKDGGPDMKEPENTRHAATLVDAIVKAHLDKRDAALEAAQKEVERLRVLAAGREELAAVLTAPRTDHRKKLIDSVGTAQDFERALATIKYLHEPSNAYTRGQILYMLRAFVEEGHADAYVACTALPPGNPSAGFDVTKGRNDGGPDMRKTENTNHIAELLKDMADKQPAPPRSPSTPTDAPIKPASSGTSTVKVSCPKCRNDFTAEIDKTTSTAKKLDFDGNDTATSKEQSAQSGSPALLPLVLALLLTLLATLVLADQFGLTAASPSWVAGTAKATRAVVSAAASHAAGATKQVLARFK